MKKIILALAVVTVTAAPALAIPCWHGIADSCYPTPDELMPWMIGW